MASEKLKIHPVCELFPPMSAELFAKLKADISTHGVREPIVIHEQFIVDGKNRFRACNELGIECPSRPWEGGESLTLWALSKNLHRRHLTPSERAVIAQKMVPLIEAETKAPKPRSTPATVGQSPRRTNAADSREHERDAVKTAASAVGVSSRLVSQADAVAKAAPEKLDEVAAGKKSVGKAYREVTAPTPAEPSDSPPTDGRGKPVEDRKLWEAFRSESHEEIIRQLRRAKADAKALCGTPLGAHLQLQAVTADIDNAINAIKFAAPYAPCPYCRADGCKVCKKTGWVGKTAFESAPPENKAAI